MKERLIYRINKYGCQYPFHAYSDKLWYNSNKGIGAHSALMLYTYSYCFSFVSVLSQVRNDNTTVSIP